MKAMTEPGATGVKPSVRGQDMSGEAIRGREQEVPRAARGVDD